MIKCCYVCKELKNEWEYPEPFDDNRVCNECIVRGDRKKYMKFIYEMQRLAYLYPKKYDEKYREYHTYDETKYNQLKKRNRKKGFSEVISYNDFAEWWITTEDKCYYCGMDIREHIRLKDKLIGYKGNDMFVLALRSRCYDGDSSKNINHMVIDRKDSFRGYVKDNMVKACLICNRIKGQFIEAHEMKEIGKRIIERLMERLKGL